MLNWVKTKACQARRVLHVLQIVTGLVSLYLLVSILITTTLNPEGIVNNIFLISSLTITVITSLAFVKRKAWLKITPPNCD